MSDIIPQPAGSNPATPPQEPQPPAQSAATLTQEQFNAAIAEEKRKWKQQQDTQVAEAARKAAETEAAAKGEFEKLATERAARITQLETEHVGTGERLTAMTEAMEKQIKARLKALPDELSAMIPATADVLTRYEMTIQAEAAAKTLAATRTPGTPSGPRGSGATALTSGDSADLIAKKRAQVGGI